MLNRIGSYLQGASRCGASLLYFCDRTHVEVQYETENYNHEKYH